MPRTTDPDATAAALAVLAGDAPRDRAEHRSSWWGGAAAQTFSPFLWLSAHTGADTGITVTPELALTCSAVYGCVSVISSAIAGLPLHVVDRQTEQRVDHELQDLLDEPNGDMTSATFWETYCVNLLTHGNGYAAVPRDARYRPTQMLPMRSADTEPRRQDGRLLYVNRTGDRTYTLRPDQVLFTPNMSFDGICGISPIVAARSAVGLSLALEQFAAHFFKNGANVQSILELPMMSDAALAEFKRRWQSEYAGIENSHKTAAAPGLKAHRTGVSPEEAQALDSRVHQVREVCRIYRVPPHKVMDLERATFSNIEEQNRDFAENALRPWVVKIEQALCRVLLREDEKRKLRIKFNLDAAIRASLKDRMDADAKGVQAGILTPNEARSHHGLPPVDGGDKLLSPMNMKPADQRGHENPAPAA
jgi:HK97 family phage portal protein